MPPLGQAIARVLSERDEKIAILGVGGLSGEPHGYLAGWVDELLDDWVLTRLRRGRSEQLASLWDVESITLKGETRGIRNWIVVGAAMETLGAKAKIVDYIRFHHATVGTAFACWEP
jgi:protocatechuate 4,5-dioxygenase beta chain